MNVRCDVCNSIIEEGDEAGDFTIGTVKRILVDAMNEEVIPDYDPSGPEWFLCSGCSRQVREMLNKARVLMDRDDPDEPMGRPYHGD